jgi:hypothetical protein
MLQDLSQRMIMASGEFQKMVAQEGLKGQNEANVANIHGQYGLENSRILAQGRENVAGINAQARMSNIQNVIGELSKKVAAGTATEDERKMLAYANQTQQMIRSGNPMASQLLGIQTESNVPQVPGQPAVPQTGPGAIDPAAVQEAMRRRGLIK